MEARPESFKVMLAPSNQALKTYKAAKGNLNLDMALVGGRQFDLGRWRALPLNAEHVRQTKMAIQIGQAWPHSALLGAGLSRNWGGYLASEMWGAMLSDPLLETHDDLRQLLLAESDFEVVLAEVRSHSERYSAEKVAVMQRVVRNAFTLHDQNLRHRLGDTGGPSELWIDFIDMMIGPLVDAPDLPGIVGPLLQ